MAANRFATLLHRNTNKITLILIYAVLEWILIVLLLLNSLFSYLILKFAEFFGLKPPCPWCARIDHIFDPSKGNRNMHRDLLCEVHAKEVSRLGYCSNHQKLVESQELCEDCLSSRPELHGFSSKNSGLFPLMKGLGMIQNGEEKVGENGEVSLNCSCCGVSLDYNNSKYSSYILLKTSSWDVLERAQKDNLLTEAGDYDDNHDIQLGFDSVEKESDFGEKCLKDENESGLEGNFELKENETEENGCVSVSENEWQEFEGADNEKVQVLLETEDKNPTLIMEDKAVQVCVEEESPVVETSNQHLEFFLDYSGHTLVPIELIEEHKSDDDDDDDEVKDQEFSPNSEAEVKEKEELMFVESRNMEKRGNLLDVDINEEPKFTMLESMEMEEDENSLVFHAKDNQMSEEFGNFRAFPLIRWSSGEVADAQEQHEGVHIDNVACEEEVAHANNENEADVSIGTEIPDLDITDEIIQIQDSADPVQEDPSTSSAHLYNHGLKFEEEMAELQCISVQESDHMTNNLEIEEDKVPNLELNENEEDKFPDTPTSIDSLNQLTKKFLYSGTEESLDGSVTSELDGCDGVVTIERLKTALRSERKALHALYAELEEERSASAVAANQTMAMINRLQEEKAAMQMEALQYQRMMEEQSEYDQEALQLLNELMVKREKEKQELERELEGYRKKLLDYEIKEKMRKSKNGSSRSGFSSASCSNGEESDGMSIDLNQEAKVEGEGYFGHNQDYGNGNGDQNTPIEAVVNLEESLADFEEERLSILEQLKVLEEKLLTLDNDDGEQHFEDVEENGHANGFLTNGKHPKKIGAHKGGKSLLPLFDAICDENGDGMLNGNGNGFDGNGIHDSYESETEIEDKKLAIEEEVDHLYLRLRALEADREFLKHCISSLKKGDKGMYLLQEILQHLRDLRNVELRARNLSDEAII